ncbi:Origin recognition complex, subunit 6 [Dillenia turbinata]|uniref:Origin recognition complex, subunit 6 n=1 Tax=Dillenia turbinata TaxID=194707 RepID=A0AAN8ZPK6_9MAGN
MFFSSVLSYSLLFSDRNKLETTNGYGDRYDLKLGNKVYFEYVGIGVNTKSGIGPSSNPPVSVFGKTKATAPVKKSGWASCVGNSAIEGEVCKAIICLEITASRLYVIFHQQNSIKLSEMSEKAYNRSFNAMQNGLEVKTKLDIRELGIQFGCVRLIPLRFKSVSIIALITL